jgi:outer membrane biosynthesis protein TonB
MSPKEEKRNQRIGWSVSIGLHAVLLLFFILILAWREPDPPVPEYGIELNFGIDDAGTGVIQPSQPTRVPDEPVEQESEPEQLESEPVEQDAEIQDTETKENTGPPEIQEEEIMEEETSEQPVETQPEESPDVVQPSEPTPQVAEKEVEKIAETKQEPKETKVSEINQVQESTGTTDEVMSDQTSTSQGDDAEIEGDEGDTEGTIDSRALYGSQGGGGGPLLEMSGWIWDFEPDPRDTSNENGKVVFEIKIDDRGEIISVRTLEKTVSPDIERIYKQEVESLTFSPTSSNTRPAPVSTGKITFIIRSK